MKAKQRNQCCRLISPLTARIHKLISQANIPKEEMGKSVIFAAKGCLKLACKHPSLTCMLCFLMFMYRSSPFMFSLLVSTSPVIVCTALLLGALLSLGQPKVLENGADERRKRVAALVKTGQSRVCNIGQNGGCYVKRGVGKQRDEPGQAMRGASLSGCKFGKSCKVGSLVGDAALGENLGIGLGKGNSWEVNGKLGNRRRKTKSQRSGKSSEEVMEKCYGLSRKVNENLETEYEKSDVDSFDSERVNVDTPARSPRKKVQNRVDEDEKDDMWDSCSDGVETDASVESIMPMLDELHPLLHEDSSEPVQMSLQASHATSEMSPRSSTSGNVSDVDTLDDLEGADNDEEQAITWTEEDQKNLQDLGSSEIKRNQRLESLMQRRRERKYKRMVSEMNLIDLESFNPSAFNIASILTRRQNPFNIHNDSYASGLPPLPLSAPPVLCPSKNPFDTPCYLGEAKANHLADRVQDEHTLLQPREQLFRRHESYDVGPSVFAAGRQEKQDVKFSPYFIPELGYFHQPSSEMSDSRLSSMPETASVSSVEDMDDQRHAEEDSPKELEAISGVAEVTENHLSGDQEQEKHKEPKVLSTLEETARRLPSGDGERNSKGEVPATRYHSGPGAAEQRSGKGSSPSSLLEATERVFNKTDVEEVAKNKVADDRDKESVYNSARSSVASSPTNRVQHKESVYNSFNAQQHGNVDCDASEAAQRSEVQEGSGDHAPAKSFNDKNSGHSEEKHSTVLERESLNRIRVSQSRGQEEASNSIDKEKVVASQDDDDDDDYQEASVKISTPSVGASTTVFYDIKMHDPNAERLEEVQVPNTPIDPDKFQATPNLNIPKIHELIDTATTAEHADSPYTPNLTPKSSTVSKESGARPNMQTILEEGTEAKETEENSTSDNEAEIYWETHSSAFDKYVEYFESPSSSDGGEHPSAEKLGSVDGDTTNVEEINSNNGSAVELSATKAGESMDKGPSVDGTSG